MPATSRKTTAKRATAATASPASAPAIGRGRRRAQMAADAPTPAVADQSTVIDDDAPDAPTAPLPVEHEPADTEAQDGAEATIDQPDTVDADPAADADSDSDSDSDSRRRRGPRQRPDAATPPEAADGEASATDDVSTLGDAEAPRAGDSTGDVVGPVSAPPARPADRKVLIVAGVLGDNPGGATVAEISAESGLATGTVVRLLAAMEYAGAAERIPADEHSGMPDRWTPGTTKASEVDPTNVPAPPAPQPCPTCGHVTRTRSVGPGGYGVRRLTAAPGFNSDGTSRLGKGALRALVLEFVNAHPGHVLSPSTIAKELERSSGAVGNALDVLAAHGQITLATEAPRAFTAHQS